MPSTARPSVLFVCTHNSARSVLAEALLRQRAGERVRVFSAGTAPRGVHPGALAALDEAGVSTAGLASDSIDDALVAIGGRPDVVVTVCDNAREACPVVPAGRTLHHAFPDPSAAPEADRPAAFAAVRDAIAAWLDADLIPSLSLPR